MAYTQAMGRDFWFAFDNATQGSDAFMDVVGRSGAGRIQVTYRTTRDNGTYPTAFSAAVAPRKTDWVTIAELQSSMFTQTFHDEWADIQAAFEDFGQGTLLDTRPERGADIIHLMDIGQSGPVGYHRWHASVRAIQALGIGDSAWWEQLDRLIGLAWAIQSFARPTLRPTPNPALGASDIQGIRDAWLPLSASDRDRQFDLPHGQSSGYHPSPKLLVA